MSHRMERVAEQIRAEAAQVLRDEVKDPRIRLVSLSRVDVSRDLGVARVYWSSLELVDEVDIEAMAEGLASASGFVRRQLAERLSLRHMPELRFVHDTSVAEGARMVELLRELGDERERREARTAAAAEAPDGGDGEEEGANGGSS